MPPRNGTAVVLIHGSTGNRARVADRARLLARHGYGVLAIDLPGNGESDGYSNGLGDNAQPAVTKALDYLAAAPRSRSADRRLRRARSAARSCSKPPRATTASGRDLRWLRAPRGRGHAAHDQHRPRDGARDVRHAAGACVGRPHAVEPDAADRIRRARGDPVNRRYAESAAADAQLWEIPEAGHTGGLRARPAEYERRVIDFLDYASTG